MAPPRGQIDHLGSQRGCTDGCRLGPGSDGQRRLLTESPAAGWGALDRRFCFESNGALARPLLVVRTAPDGYHNRIAGAFVTNAVAEGRAVSGAAELRFGRR